MARRRTATAREARESGGLGPFVWGLIVGTAMVITGGYFLLPPPAPPGLATETAPPGPATAAGSSTATGTPPIASPGAPSGEAGAAQPATERYDFYTILQDMEVKVPDWQMEEERSVEAQPATAADTGGYVLQVGSFKEFGDADRVKADLALKGVTAGIQTVTINGNERWYRVRVGPFDSVGALKEARAGLIAQGIGFIVVKDRKP
jgi:cell division protein FtsN